METNMIKYESILLFYFNVIFILKCLFFVSKFKLNFITTYNSKMKSKKDKDSKKDRPA